MWMLSICLRRSCFRLWFIRHIAHSQYLTPSNSSQIIFCSKNSPTLSCSTNTEKRNPLILVCRVDVTLESSPCPKYHFVHNPHFVSTVWAAVWVCFHVKALNVSVKSTLVVQNLLTNSTDPELHPRRGLHLTDRLAFNVFQNFVLLDIHWNEARLWVVSRTSLFQIICAQCSCVFEVLAWFWIESQSKTHSCKGQSPSVSFPRVSPDHIFSSGTFHKQHISSIWSHSDHVHRRTVLQWKTPLCAAPHRLKETQMFICA